MIAVNNPCSIFHRMVAPSSEKVRIPVGVSFRIKDKSHEIFLLFNDSDKKAFQTHLHE
jgi:hypothetical protein